MIRQFLYIYEFSEGALGIVHTEEHLARHYIKQLYELPDLENTFEIELPSTASPEPVIVFVRGVITLKRRILPKIPNKNAVNEQVYDERRTSTFGPRNGIKEMDDFSITGSA